MAWHFYLCLSASSNQGWGGWSRLLEVSWQGTIWALGKSQLKLEGKTSPKSSIIILCPAARLSSFFLPPCRSLSPCCALSRLRRRGDLELWVILSVVPFWTEKGMEPLCSPLGSSHALLTQLTSLGTRAWDIAQEPGQFRDGSPIFTFGLPFPQCAYLVFSGLSAPRLGSG